MARTSRLLVAGARSSFHPWARKRKTEKHTCNLINTRTNNNENQWVLTYSTNLMEKKNKHAPDKINTWMNIFHVWNKNDLFRMRTWPHVWTIIMCKNTNIQISKYISRIKSKKQCHWMIFWLLSSRLSIWPFSNEFIENF